MLLLPTLACPKAAAPADAGASVATLPSPIQFTGQETHFLFSFVDPMGGLRSVDKLSDVPAAQRRSVMVVDLSKTPEERQADQYVFFADVSTPGPDGRHHANPVSRYQAPALVSSGSGLMADLPTGQGVVVYSAEWCGFCKKTKSFLRERGVAFKERDVEKDSGAEAELQAKARKAGVRVSGVPVTDFNGELIMGFDQPRLESLIRKAKEASP